MVSREILIVAGGLAGAEATGVTNLTSFGGGGSDSEEPEVPSIGGSVPSLDFSGLGKAFGKVAEAGSSAGSNFDLELGSPSGFEGLKALTQAQGFDPGFDSPKNIFDGNNKGKKSGGSGNLEDVDERFWKNFEENSKDVSSGVGGMLEEITLGTGEEFVVSAKERLNPPVNSDLTGTPEATEGQAKLAESAFNPNKSTSEAFDDARQEVNKNKKKSSGSSGDSGGSSSSSSGGSSDFKTGFSEPEPEPVLNDSEVEGKTESEAQADKADKAFSIDKKDSEGNTSTKNKKKDDDGFSNPFLR